MPTLARSDDRTALAELARLVAAHLAAMPDPLDEVVRREAARLEGYRRGWRHGREQGRLEGYAECAADVMAAEHGLYDHLHSANEIERRRWGPGGRARFADPRPGDYPGKGGEPA